MFSDDGVQHWKSKKRIQRARRSQCRGWWNPEWRDRTLATIQWLANGAEELNIQLGSDVLLKVKCHPVPFISDVSYSDPGVSSPTQDAGKEEAEEIEEVELEEFGDDEADENEDEE